MKNEVNRALAAKKKIYNQPEVTVAQIALDSMVLAGSPTPPSSNSMNMNTGVPTDDQW